MIIYIISFYEKLCSTAVAYVCIASSNSIQANPVSAYKSFQTQTKPHTKKGFSTEIFHYSMFSSQDTVRAWHETHSSSDAYHCTQQNDETSEFHSSKTKTPGKRKRTYM